MFFSGKILRKKSHTPISVVSAREFQSREFTRLRIFPENAQPNKQNDSPVVTGYQCMRLQPAQDWCQSSATCTRFFSRDQPNPLLNRIVSLHRRGLSAITTLEFPGEAENLKNAIPYETLCGMHLSHSTTYAKPIEEIKRTICSLYFMIFLLYIFVIHILLHKFDLLFFCCFVFHYVFSLVYYFVSI